MNNKHWAITRSALRCPVEKFVIPNKCVGAGQETSKLPYDVVRSGLTSTSGKDDFGFHNSNTYNNPLVLAVYHLADEKSDDLDVIGDSKYKDSCNQSSRRKKRGRPSKKNDEVIITPSYHSPKYEEDVYEAPWPADFYSSYPFDHTVGDYNPQRPFDYAGANYISAYPYVYAASLASMPTSSRL